MSTVGVLGVSVPEARASRQRIYPFMAGLFLVTPVVGFGPTSLTLLATVEAGERPPLPLILHVHAVCMVMWLVLLLVQTSLVATGRTALHRSLGLAALVVAPAAVAAMIRVALESWRAIAALGTSAGPEWMASMAGASNILLEQIRSVLFFAVFVGWALVVRRRRRDRHRARAAVRDRVAAFVGIGLVGRHRAEAHGRRRLSNNEGDPDSHENENGIRGALLPGNLNGGYRAPQLQRDLRPRPRHRNRRARHTRALEQPARPVFDRG